MATEETFNSTEWRRRMIAYQGLATWAIIVIPLVAVGVGVLIYLAGGTSCEGAV